MTSHSIESPFDETTEEIISRFEAACLSDQPFDFQAAVDSLATPDRDALVAELACIQLEFLLAKGGAEGTSSVKIPSPLIAQFPEVFCQEIYRNQVAQEHLRICRFLRSAVSVKEIADIYQVDAHDWPQQWSEGDTEQAGDNQQTPCDAGLVRFPTVSSLFCGYELVGELGRGALSRVYLARQPDLDRRLVVLKVSPRLTTEANQLARLQHAGIVAIYSVHQQDGLFAICMPYRGALTLRDLLENDELIQSTTQRGPSADNALVSTFVVSRASTILKSSVGLSLADQSMPTADVSEEASPASGRLTAEQLGLQELPVALQAKFRTATPLTAKVTLATQVVQAVAYAHSRQVIHRDLKPENILISNDGSPLVLDFNLASGEAEVADLIGGTRPYMSPQHLAAVTGSGECTAADDVYSLGVILFELLTGRHPFPDRNLTDPFWNLAEVGASQVEPPACREIHREISPSLSNIVAKALASTREARYRSAGELAEDLSRWLENRPLKHAPDRSLTERGLKFVRRHPLLASTTTITGLAGTLVVLLVVSLWYGKQHAGRLTAEREAERLQAVLPETIAKLSSPGLEPELMQLGLSDATAITDLWRLSEAGFADDSPLFRLRSDEQPSVMLKLGRLTKSMSAVQARLQSTIAGTSYKEHDWMQATQAIASQLLQLDHDASASVAETFDDVHDGQWGDALERAERACSESPTDPSHWFSLGSLYYLHSDFQAAENAYDVAAKLQSSSAAAVYWRGISRLRLEQFAAAEADFSQCLEMYPEWSAARFNRALARRGQGDLLRAIEDVDAILERQHATPRVYGLRSKLTAGLGNRDQAIIDRQSALQASPRNAEDWVVQGVLQIQTAPDRAMECFATALQWDATQAAAYQNMAHVQAERLGDTTGAIASMSKLITQQPTASTYASRGILYARLAHREEALADAEEASKLTPGPLEMLQISGIHAQVSRTEAGKQVALQWLARAVAAQPALARLAALDSDLEELRELPLFQAIVSGQGNESAEAIR